MRGNFRGSNIVINGEIAPESAFGKLPVENVIYEVIRVIDSRLVFASDHINRLQNSCEANGITCPEKQIILSGIQLLINHTKFHLGNIKVLVFKNQAATSWACFFIPHKYPEPFDYINGVKLKTFPFERPDPTIKKWNDKFRKEVNAYIVDNHIYEALLVNREGFITEGSRSNIFFLNKNGIIYTSPENSVLPGITRAYVYDICKQYDYPIIEKMIHQKELTQLSGCFLTGTSPKVLPVRKIDEVSYFASHEIIHRIMQAFDHLVKQQKVF